MKPNVICIVSDDQGPWALGAAGNPEIRTPQLDRLAATGTRFENMFCVSPVCSPARASIMTGKIPSQHGVQDWLRKGNSPIESPEDGYVHRYLAGHVGYTEILAQAGYNCGMAGKWHLGDAHTPQMGFSYWYAHAKGASDYYGAPMIENGELQYEPRYVTDVITDRALDFLSAQSPDRPFCLHVNYTAPHSPWDAGNHPAELFNDYYNNCKFDSIPREPIHRWQMTSAPVGYDEESRRAVLSGYFAAVTAMDTNIGRILDWIDERGIQEETIVFFTSDNGMNMGHHGIYGKGNGTFPQNMFDTSVKVPAIISHPGSIPAGAVCDALISHYDYMPTILDILDLDPAAAKLENLPGRSAKRIINGEESAVHDHVVVYNEYGPVRMIRDREYKYVHRYPHGPHELYRIADDPDERWDLFGIPAYQEKVEELRGKLEEWFVSYVDPRIDATREAVTGRGQSGPTGVDKQGKEVFSDDFVFYYDDKAKSIGFDF